MKQTERRDLMTFGALRQPRTRANKPPETFFYSKDDEWRAAVTVNK